MSDEVIERFNALLTPAEEPERPQLETREEPINEPTEERPRVTARELIEKYQIDPDEFYNARLVIDGGDSPEEVSIGEWKDARRDVRQLERTRAEIGEEAARISHDREAARRQIEDLGARAQQAEVILKSVVDSFHADARAVDWAYLQDTDPAEYQAKRLEFQDREAQIQQMAHGAQQLKLHAEQERQNHEQQKLQEHYRSEQKKLLELIPELDPRKHGSEPLGTFLIWAEQKGFSPNYINTISDARLVAALHKSMKYDELVSRSSATVKKIFHNQKRILKSGPRQTVTRDDTSNLRATLRKTGHVNDAAKLISRMRGD